MSQTQHVGVVSLCAVVRRLIGFCLMFIEQLFVLDARETGKQEQTAVLLTLLPQTLSSSVLKVTLLQILKAEVHNLGSKE